MAMLSLIWAVLVGFFVGLIARALHRGDDKAGFWATSALGIVGSLLVTALGQLLGWYDRHEEAGFIMSVIGAVIVLAIYNMIRRKRLQGPNH
jgi:uncharacterized membrane protein YeaQ/YmgE (transglycosylase-associated protein family)